MKIRLSKSEAEVLLADHFARIGGDGGSTPEVEIVVECDREHVDADLLTDEVDRVPLRKTNKFLDLVRSRNIGGTHLWGNPGIGKTSLFKKAAKKVKVKAKAKKK